MFAVGLAAFAVFTIYGLLERAADLQRASDEREHR